MSHLANDRAKTTIGLLKFHNVMLHEFTLKCCKRFVNLISGIANLTTPPIEQKKTQE